MELPTCTHCGAAIEGEGIRHRRRLFCSDECCETFEEKFLSQGGPDAEDLAEDDDLEDGELFEDEFFDGDDDGDGDGEDHLDDDEF